MLHFNITKTRRLCFSFYRLHQYDFDSTLEHVGTIDSNSKAMS